MKMKLSDLLILSDVDGTLYEDPSPIHPRNITALTRFTQKGGRFALATGRAIQSTQNFVDQLPVNAPCILFNGAGLYDYTTQKLLAGYYLPESAFDYVQVALDAFEQVGAVFFGEEAMYIAGHFCYAAHLLKDDRMPILQGTLDQLRSRRWFKVIFCIEPEEMGAFQAFIKKHPWQDVGFVASSGYFYEMLPLDISKETGLRHLSKLTETPISHIVAIGDYYNDERMLMAAGIAATVADAPDDIKAHCKLITGCCKDGALADLVEHLEQLCE